MRVRSLLVVSVLLVTACGGAAGAASDRRVAVVLTGGHLTDPADNGRPVVLVAAGLGLPPGVFREAFSRVRPAPAGTDPAGTQVSANKQVLLAALSSYGVTNDLLDTVSNHYRYDASAGQLWPTSPAAAYAVVRRGRVVLVVVTNGGSGYTSVPVVTVPGVAARARAALSFGRDLATNGRVAAVTLG